MDLNEILVFARVVQCGSFTAAARLLGMPKSSVSKKIADLEDRIGARLLQRTTRTLSLTDAGRLYFERAARIVEDVEDAEHAVNELQATPRGLLRVTAPLSFGILGPVVSTFLRDHPEVEVEVVCTDRKVDLVEESFDLAIRAGRLEDSTLIARPLGTMQRLLVAAPNYLGARGSPATPQALTEHACIAFGSGEAPRLWTLEHGGKRERVQITPRLLVNDFEIMRDATLAGVGIAFLLESFAQPGITSGQLECVLREWRSPATPVHVLYPTSRHLSPKVVTFVEALRGVFARGAADA